MSGAEGPRSIDDVVDVAQVPIPAELGVLPLRGAVVYPWMVLPVSVSRGKSQTLLDEVAVGPGIFAVVAQRREEDEDPAAKDLHEFGTACRILRLLKLPDGTLRVLLQGLRRVRLDEFLAETPYFKARATPLEDRGADGVRVDALAASARELFRRLVELSSALTAEHLTTAESIPDPSRLADFIAASLSGPLAERQQALEAVDVGRRLEIVASMLTRELKVAEIQGEILGKVKEEMGRKSREAVLREQLHQIQSELGEDDSRAAETEDLRAKIEAAGMSEEARDAALKELDRLSRMHPSSAEHAVIRTWLDWLLAVPWKAETEDRLDLTEARRILDEDHYDLEPVKDRIIEFLAVLALKKDLKGPILCLLGPPGVGKTSLGVSIARAMGRKFARLSLGGVRDEAEIRGHRRTYVGAMPGRIVQALKRVGVRNPVFMLDEVDKLGADFRGDPSSALLEVLDPAQNSTFQDHYLEATFDLSRVLFIATANVLETIPPPLRDRMEILALPGYIEDQKVGIAREHLLPEQLVAHGIEPGRLTIDEPALRAIIGAYTREAGVRNLERQLGTICRKTARRIVAGEPGPFAVSEAELPDLLGPPRFFSEIAERTATPGVVTGLVWTPVGGEIIFIEATRMPGRRNFTLTGSLGEVMKESAMAALSWVRANAVSLGIDPEEFEKYDVHLHVPAGATPKDGPSAGVAMATALASLFTGRPIRSDVAMTGEITLRGRVLPVGGIREKVLGALRAGIRTVILPDRNERDLSEVPDVAQRQIEFVFAGRVEDVLARALVPAEPSVVR